VRPRLLPVSLVLLVLAATGCTGAGVDFEPLPPPPVVPETTTTTAVDFSAIGLPGVVGRTTTTLAVGPGAASVGGTVSGPDGAVDGAVVRIERLVGDARASADVLTQPDGTWTMPGLLGGRYRVRAWRAPDLALTRPEVFFLEAGATKVLDLVLTRFAGVAISLAIAPNPPLIDGPANLAVRAVDRVVDSGGVVRVTPLARVNAELFGNGDWRLRSPNPTVTDGTGTARWQLICGRVGGQDLSVLIADTHVFPLALPPCGAAPPTTEPEEPVDATTTTTARRATTTTVRPTTTTTTRGRSR
jgi:hypothetical protein